MEEFTSNITGDQKLDCFIWGWENSAEARLYRFLLKPLLFNVWNLYYSWSFDSRPLPLPYRNFFMTVGFIQFTVHHSPFTIHRIPSTVYCFSNISWLIPFEIVFLEKFLKIDWILKTNQNFNTAYCFPLTRKLVFHVKKKMQIKCYAKTHKKLDFLVEKKPNFLV